MGADPTKFLQQLLRRGLVLVGLWLTAVLALVPALVTLIYVVATSHDTPTGGCVFLVVFLASVVLWYIFVFRLVWRERVVPDTWLEVVPAGGPDIGRLRHRTARSFAATIFLLGAAGITMSLAALTVWWLFVPALGRDKPPIAVCHSRVYAILEASFHYSFEHEGRLPADFEELEGFVLLHEDGRPEADAIRACPLAHKKGVTAPSSDYEYVGGGVRTDELKDPAAVPLVFDREGNHRNHTRTVGCAGMGRITTRDLVRLLTEKEFRELLVQAVRSGAYPPTTVERLKMEEPWLDKALAGGLENLPGGRPAQ